MNNFGEQVLLWSARVEALAETKMFLPLPMRANARSGTLRMQGYKEMFADMEKCWEPSFALAKSPPHGPITDDDSVSVIPLPTADADVGILSTPREISRAGAEALLKEPAYVDWGCAALRIPAGENMLGPFALVFQAREPNKIFFPLREIVDRSCPERVDRDHRLYLQNWNGTPVDGWFESDSCASTHVDLSRSQKMVHGDLLIHRIELKGSRKNEDIWVRID